MKQKFLKYFIVFLVAVFAEMSYAATEPPLLNLTLQPEFEKELHCSWKPAGNVRFWVGNVEDARDEKPLGVMEVGGGAVPLFATKPLPQVFQELLKAGLTGCGAKLVNNKEAADIWFSGNIDDFSGASKKGLLKGKATGRLEFTLNLKRPSVNDHLSLSFELEETQMKGISKKPKKLELVLNNLLTRLGLDIFKSDRLAMWLK